MSKIIIKRDFNVCIEFINNIELLLKTVNNDILFVKVIHESENIIGNKYITATDIDGQILETSIEVTKYELTENKCVFEYLYKINSIEATAIYELTKDGSYTSMSYEVTSYIKSFMLRLITKFFIKNYEKNKDELTLDTLTKIKSKIESTTAKV